jgi:hypothetical protein
MSCAVTHPVRTPLIAGAELLGLATLALAAFIWRDARKFWPTEPYRKPR